MICEIQYEWGGIVTIKTTLQPEVVQIVQDRRWEEQRVNKDFDINLEDVQIEEISYWVKKYKVMGTS